MSAKTEFTKTKGSEQSVEQLYDVIYPLIVSEE
jgi:hypothetical protein